MTDLDLDADGKFDGLDARAAQDALEEEMTDTEENETIEPATEAEAANDEGEAVVEPPQFDWSEEEFAEHGRMVEALLFAAAEPLDLATIAGRLPTGADVPAILERLAALYDGRGVMLAKTDNKWRFVTSPDVAHVLDKEKIVQRRLSRAALETLAVIAYHQPCTRADIEDVRGVAVAKGSLDQLLEIGWVRLRGRRRHAPGRPVLFGTSQDFLEHFGIEAIEDLPGIADLKAAGLLEARLPPDFMVPTPRSPEEGEDEDIEGDDPEFSQDFLEEEPASAENDFEDAGEEA